MDDDWNEPGVIIASGIAGTGKTTVLRNVVSRIPIALLIEKDAINQGLLYINDGLDNHSLLPFEDYVAGDTTKAVVSTPTIMGPMFKIPFGAGFYGRHVRDQTYLVMEAIAQRNIQLGKIAVVDCIVIRQIRDGTLRRFMDSPSFVGYPIHLIHFTADEGDIYNRLEARKDVDPVAYARTSQWTESPDTFHRFVAEVQPLVPLELASYEHLLVNTSRRGVTECTDLCLEYICRNR